MYNVFKGGDVMKKRRSVYCTDDEYTMIKTLLKDFRFYADRHLVSDKLVYVIDNMALHYYVDGDHNDHGFIV